MHLVPLTFRSRKLARFDCEIWCAATRKKDIKQSFGIAPPASKNDYQSEEKNAEVECGSSPRCDDQDVDRMRAPPISAGIPARDAERKLQRQVVPQPVSRSTSCSGSDDQSEVKPRSP
jgi:hypothetical protein